MQPPSYGDDRQLMVVVPGEQHTLGTPAGGSGGPINFDRFCFLSGCTVLTFIKFERNFRLSLAEDENGNVDSVNLVKLIFDRQVFPVFETENLNSA